MKANLSIAGLSKKIKRKSQLAHHKIKTLCQLDQLENSDGQAGHDSEAGQAGYELFKQWSSWSVLVSGLLATSGFKTTSSWEQV